jgi:hypothetical protein
MRLSTAACIALSAAMYARQSGRQRQVLTEDAVCVTNGRNAIYRPHVHTNKIASTINLGNRPCSGLAAGFGPYGSPIAGP